MTCRRTRGSDLNGAWATRVHRHRHRPDAGLIAGQNRRQGARVSRGDPTPKIGDLISGIACYGDSINENGLDGKKNVKKHEGVITRSRAASELVSYFSRRVVESNGCRACQGTLNKMPCYRRSAQGIRTAVRGKSTPTGGISTI